MRIVALDTSTWWGGAALVESGGGDAPRVVAELGEQVRDSHAEHVLEWIERLLAGAGWTKSDVDAYAAAHGPGSFTGVRVGLGTIRGLGLATGRPCFGVTTLEALAAAHGPADRPRLSVMSAGRGELYAARYDPSAMPPVEQRAPWLESIADVLADADSAGALVVPAPGTAIETPGVTAAFEVAPAPTAVAAAVGHLAAIRAATQGGAQPLSPLYLRPPDALLKRTRS